MAGEIIDRLGIPGMDRHNQPLMETAFTASIDAATGITSGTSAADRARTIEVAADPESVPGDLVMPGHVFPLRARPGGVLQRPGQTEAAVDLARLAGLRPAGVICEVMKDDGTMARVPDLEKFFERHGVKMVTVAQIVEYRRRHDEHARCTGETRLTTKFGAFRLRIYEGDGSTHLALLTGYPEGKDDALVLIHSACPTGDALRSMRCDCGARLEAAMKRIQREGEGVIVYVRHERRGVDLLDELRTHRLLETKSHRIGAHILKDLGLKRVHFMADDAKHPSRPM
jgi:3,4-dihydroxy 2-butanone 4-phosphate synthase/GTP cyclohydrolase II